MCFLCKAETQLRTFSLACTRQISVNPQGTQGLLRSANPDLAEDRREMFAYSQEGVQSSIVAKKWSHCLRYNISYRISYVMVCYSS